ncbi:MAG: hypothetical protein ABI760_00970 [Ferruginibacter sp.]
MKPQPNHEMPTIPKNLHQLVGLAAGNSMPTAVQRNSFIVNEVPREFQIAADVKLLANILNSLLSIVVNNSKHSCIRIIAKEYEDMIFVCVRDNNSGSNYDVAGNLQQVQQNAKKMNGNVNITNMENKFTSIIFNFPNFPVTV